MDIKTLLTGIKSAVDASDLSGNVLGVTTTIFVPSSPEVPHFYPFHWRATYDRTFDNLAELAMTWHLLLSRAEEANAAEEASLLSGTGEETIRAAVHARRKQGTGKAYYGDVADDIVVRAAEGPRLFDFGTDVHFWGVEFTIFAMG